MSYTHQIGVWYSQNFKGAWLLVHGYHWVLLATIDLVIDNKEI